MIMRNTFHEALNAGKPTIGTHFLFSDPDIAELIGDTGLFDYAEFAAEYSCLYVQLLYHLARAAAMCGAAFNDQIRSGGKGLLCAGSDWCRLKNLFYSLI